MLKMPLLFTPLQIAGATLRNRVVLSPMCQYCAIDGYADDWHLVHLGKFALGGMGLVFTEATAVEERGRISYGDLGIWSDSFLPGLKRIADFVRAQGALPGIQIAHAGRKGGWQRPWQGGGGPLDAADAAQGEAAYPLVGPTAEPLAPGHVAPHALSLAEIAGVVESFASAAARADRAGFEVLEIHGAHGYLISSFLSPGVNRRNDAYGGDRAGRMRFALEVTRAVRAVWPVGKPLFFRVSSVDGAPGGWAIEDSIALAGELGKVGVDVVDCSSGGMRGATAYENSSRRPGFQVGYASDIRKANRDWRRDRQSHPVSAVSGEFGCEHCHGRRIAPLGVPVAFLSRGRAGAASGRADFNGRAGNHFGQHSILPPSASRARSHVG